ncbi:MAG: hypothetical protein HY954_06165 [Deltaproteobacteria bacterium]|nr:hypothetical protein [Deltaproteobacteria bacterium]
MRKYKMLAAALFMLILPFFIHNARAEDMTGRSGGIQATLKVDPKKSMIDLYLYDYAKALTPITEAKVEVRIRTPRGAVKKDLAGMKMGGEYSFMNSLDLSAKGRYIFDITVETGGRKANFSFSYDNK